ncbi:unnamed protein product [Spirodela intermedia]|uniref:DUF1664 domain-containing protein n=1 Tax=Spirodela intermedia TaxID=51605 RepID=A0A7I8J833_SPIIN|nr:unnamed protein product [Spirodela intermedia]CAA6666210.1 unnamed protein product [Spirodela intermedia]
MAMQSGIGLSKILIFIGAGYTGSIVLRNGKLSDILGDVQVLVKGLENSKESSHKDSESSHLSNQVFHRHSFPWITILVASLKREYKFPISPLIVPLASLGALGYGYLWWKGYSLTDLMYVTKRNMANAVSSMTKHLDQVSSALAAAKRHLTQRIENLDGKVDEQNSRLKEIKYEVTDANGKLGKMDGKVNSIEVKQDLACQGVLYLCQFVNDKGGKTPEFLLNMAKSTTGKRIGFSEPMSLKGLQHIAESLERPSPLPNEIPQIEIDPTENLKQLPRTASIKC